jgi:hypothetical protein
MRVVCVNSNFWGHGFLRRVGNPAAQADLFSEKAPAGSRCGHLHECQVATVVVVVVVFVVKVVMRAATISQIAETHPPQRATAISGTGFEQRNMSSG